jgi:hypothetical protein
MQSAFIFGLSASRDALSRNLAFNCPTGNCKWETFQSLAVCSSCADIKQHLHDDFKIVPLLGGTGTVQGQSLPNGAFVAVNKTNMGTHSSSIRNESLAFKDRDLFFWSTMLLRNKNNGTLADISATECILEYCVREFHSNVTNGTLFETSSRVKTAKRSRRSWMPAGQEYLNWTTEDTWSYADDLNITPRPVGIHRTDLMIGDGYNISQTAVLGIESMLKSVLTTNGTSGSIPYDSDAGTPLANPIFLQPLFDSDDLTATFENIAISMTKRRNTGLEVLPYRITVNGQTRPGGHERITADERPSCNVKSSVRAIIGSA